MKHSFFRTILVIAILLTTSPAITDQPGWATHLQARGIQISAGVWDLSTGKLLEGFQPEVALIPASTTKVVSSYAILRTLKPDFQLETTVLGNLQKGVVTGDLVIKGGGDPFFTNEHIWMLAQALKSRGVSRVTGSLRLDQSAFDSQRYGAGWENTSSNTTPPILPLSVNFNRESNGIITRNPEKLAQDTITKIFQDSGISFERRPDTDGGEKKVIASYKSPTLQSLVNSVNKISNNFITEMLVKHFGGGSWTRSIARIQDFYKTNLDLDPSEIQITDGSGLSKSNRLSARTLSTILRAGWHDFEVGPEFVSSLKYIGGEPFTNIKDPNLTRRVRCKTGHLNDVDSMCGFIHMPDGSIRVFAILLNGPCTRDDVEYVLKLWAN